MLILCRGISIIVLFIYSSALFIEESVAITVKEVRHLGVTNALISYLCSKILHYLPYRRKVTLSKYFYVLTKLTLLL